VKVAAGDVVSKEKPEEVQEVETTAVADVPEWRRGATSVTGPRPSAEFKGYFSECSAAVQKELRETRAQLLVAKNRAAVAREEEKVRRVGSPETIVREALRVMKLAGQVKKVEKDHSIGGWARTVVEGCAESLAASAPSSVPSLESVGLTPPVDEAQSAAGARLAEYEAKRVELEAEFAELPYHTQGEYEAACKALKQEYSDVCLTDVERVEQAVSAERERIVYDMLDVLQSLDGDGLTGREVRSSAISAVVKLAV